MAEPPGQKPCLGCELRDLGGNEEVVSPTLVQGFPIPPLQGPWTVFRAAVSG